MSAILHTLFRVMLVCLFDLTLYVWPLSNMVTIYFTEYWSSRMGQMPLYQEAHWPQYIVISWTAKIPRSAQLRITSTTYRIYFVLQDCFWACLVDLQFDHFFELSSITHTLEVIGTNWLKHTSIVAFVWDPPFCNCVIGVWNSLSPAVVDFTLAL